MSLNIESLNTALDDLMSRKDVALVGPLVWYPADQRNSENAEPDDRVWTVGLCVPGNQSNGGFYSLAMHLGFCAYEPDPDDFRHFDGVLVLRRVSEKTMEQAQALRNDLIEALRSRFEKVHVASTEVEAAQICARTWPSDRSERLLRAVEAEQI